MNESISLIGMPGAGKSVIGVLLAKCLGLKFIDTDLLIQEKEGRLLQEILDSNGIPHFKKLEELTILNLEEYKAVLSTGGSAVYSGDAMRHLKTLGRIVYLELPCQEVEKRVHNMMNRGIVMDKGQTLASLCLERHDLYAEYADLTVPCAGRTVEETLSDVMQALGHGNVCAE